MTQQVKNSGDGPQRGYIMPKYRKNRINDAVAHETADIVRDIKDPRISGIFITVTGAEVTGDLKYAKIYYSCLGADEPKETAAGLRSAAPFVRRELASRLNLRITPELTFVRDNGVSHGAEIARILSDISEDRSPEAKGE